MINTGINKSRDKIKRILFIQLPLLDHGKNYTSSNYLYAPFILAGYVNKYRAEHYTADWLNPFVVNNLSDEIITDHILEYSPDIIGFTVYLWNAERSLKISEMVKKRINVQVIFGGPEIYNGSFLFYEKRHYVDIFCSGEGEWFFDLYPDAEQFSSINGNTVAVQPDNELFEIDKGTYPSMKDISKISSGGTYFIEMTRGCPFKCCYCNYSKHSRKVRLRNLKLLENEIFNSTNESIYILAPSINTRTDFIDLLDFLIQNRNRHDIHAEVNAASITKELAEKMFLAGFRSVEAGLQTITDYSRKLIGRNMNVDSEIEGISNLMNAGIRVKAGLIPGLPGDSLNEFIKGLDYVYNKGISESIELYPLMVLPGTELMDTYCESEVDIQKYPPYFLIRKDDFDIDSIKRIFRYNERRTGFVSMRRCLPDMSSSDQGQVKGVYIEYDSNPVSVDEISEVIGTSVFTIILKTSNTAQISTIIKKLCLDEKLKSTLINVVIESNVLLNDDTITRTIKGVNRDSLISRMGIFDDNENGGNVKIYQMLTDLEDYDFARLVYRNIDCLISVDEERADRLFTYIAEGRGFPKVFVRKKVFSMFRDEFNRLYSGMPDLIEFESVDDKKSFCADTEQDFNNDDYNLKIIKM